MAVINYLLEVQPRPAGTALQYKALTEGRIKKSMRLFPFTPIPDTIDIMWEVCRLIDRLMVMPVGERRSSELYPVFIHLQLIARTATFSINSDVWYNDSRFVYPQRATLTLIGDDVVVYDLIKQYKQNAPLPLKEYPITTSH